MAEIMSNDSVPAASVEIVLAQSCMVPQKREYRGIDVAIEELLAKGLRAVEHLSALQLFLYLGLVNLGRSSHPDQRHAKVDEQKQATESSPEATMYVRCRLLICCEEA